MKKVRFFGILLSLALVLALLPALGGAAWADGVSYIYYTDSAPKTPVTGTLTSAYETVSGQTAWGTANTETWYVVSSNVSISSRITVSGTVNLILCDGKTPTASKGITVASGDILYHENQTMERRKACSMAEQIAE